MRHQNMWLDAGSSHQSTADLRHGVASAVMNCFNIPLFPLSKDSLLSYTFSSPYPPSPSLVLLRIYPYFVSLSKVDHDDEDDFKQLA